MKRNLAVLLLLFALPAWAFSAAIIGLDEENFWKWTPPEIPLAISHYIVERQVVADDGETVLRDWFVADDAASAALMPDGMVRWQCTTPIGENYRIRVRAIYENGRESYNSDPSDVLYVVGRGKPGQPQSETGIVVEGDGSALKITIPKGFTSPEKLPVRPRQ